MRRTISALLAAALMALGTPALAEEVQAPELIEPVGVQLDTAVVVRQDICELRYYDAAVVPHTEELCFTVDGSIKSIDALSGDWVSKGDVLATLDQEALEEQAEDLREDIAYREAELDFARRSDQLAISAAQLELDKLRSRAAAGEVTQEQVKLAETDLDILRLEQNQARELDEFTLSSLRQKLTGIEADLGSNVITAPFDGRIVYAKKLRKGAGVKAYDAMFFIADDTRLHIDSAYISASALSAADALYARVGGNDYEIAPREFNWREYVAIALSGGELRTEFDFASDIPETVESGMYAAVFVKSGSVEDALVVPANALYSDSNGRYVYRIEDGKRVRAQVTTGRATTTLVQITDGLEEGDLVYVKE